jgi:cytochrome P450
MEQLREEVDTFMFAGHDTTSHAVAWTIWCLATHPDIQERVYNEITAEFGQSDADFKTNRIKDLKYLDMVLKEAMRLFAPVPFFQRKLKNDMELCGHLIPKNTTLSVSPFVLHRNPKIFPEPRKFNPENFAEGKEYASNAFIPFSAGPRNCIGQKFAVREAKIMLAHLLFNFKFTTDHNIMDNLPVVETVTRPSLGVPVKACSRR